MLSQVQGKHKIYWLQFSMANKKFFLTLVQRPELDIDFFTPYGAFNKQYLNGLKEGSDPNTSIENLKLYIRFKKKKSTFENGKSKDEAIDYYVSNLNIPRSWAKSFWSQESRRDSLLNLSLDISIEDIGKIRPGARLSCLMPVIMDHFMKMKMLPDVFI